MTAKLTLDEHIKLVSGVLDVCTKERLRQILDQIDPMIVTRAIAQSCGVDMTTMYLDDVDPKNQWDYKTDDYKTIGYKIDDYKFPIKIIDTLNNDKMIKKIIDDPDYPFTR